MLTAEQVYTAIGHKLYGMRESQYITAENMAAALNISLQELEEYESGKTPVTATVLYTLSKIYSCPPAKFLEGIDPESLNSAFPDSKDL